MRKNIIVTALEVFAVCLFIITCLSSCSTKVDFPFYYDSPEISKIEIVDVGIITTNHVDIRAAYPVEDTEAFLNDFSEMDCYSYMEPDSVESNSRIIKITYNTGEYELIGRNNYKRYTHNYEYFTNGVDCYFDEEQYAGLIEKYSPPRDSGDVTEYNFMYPENEITKIELVDKRFNYNLDFPIDEVELYPVSDTETFLSDVREMECRTGGWAKWNESRDTIKTIKRIIKVSYKSGEYEYISADGYLQHRHEYVFKSGTNYLSGTDCKCFNKEQFDELIRKYSP